MQILALFAMECPVSLEAEDIRNEKVKLLRNIKPIALDDVVVGQYRGVSVPGQGFLPGVLRTPPPCPTPPCTSEHVPIIEVPHVKLSSKTRTLSRPLWSSGALTLLFGCNTKTDKDASGFLACFVFSDFALFHLFGSNTKKTGRLKHNSGENQIDATCVHACRVLR